MESTDDWCFATDHNGVITEEKVGGTDCHQMVGISYWSEADGIKLANDLNEVYLSQGGKERYWEQVPLVYKRKITRCMFVNVLQRILQRLIHLTN